MPRRDEETELLPGEFHKPKEYIQVTKHTKRPGKLQTPTGSIDREPVANLRSSMSLRLGQLGNNGELWDNGFYVKGYIDDQPLDILIDNGSTTTILSNRIFRNVKEIKEDTDFFLEPTENKLHDVNGNPLKTYGKLHFTLKLGNAEYDMRSLVCEIDQDAILGQDFLLQNVERIDYKRQILSTPEGQFKCWIGGEANVTCRVLSKETIKIPGRSRMLIPVQIEHAKHLGDLGLVDNNPKPGKEQRTQVTRGILDPHLPEVEIQVVNFGEEPETIHTKECIATCETYYEAPFEGRCSQISTRSQTTEGIPEHLEDLWERSSVHLKKEETESLKQLLVNYADVFSKSPGDLGRTDRVQHRIDVGNAIPVRQPPRRLPIGKRETEKNEIAKMLERGVIEPSISPWSSCAVILTKKDGTPRFCVDYRILNQYIVNKMAYPIPRIDDCLDALSGAKWFSCLDLNQGFHQVELHPDDRDKTAFSSSQGLFQFTVVPFGLATSPAVFERLMEDVLRGLQWEECMIYMDDIIVPGTNVEQELTRLEHVFQRMREANLKLKPSKCCLFQRSVKFLGHVVSEKGIQTDPEKIEAIKNWPTPRTAKQVKSWIGLCSYYRKFVKGFADISRPLHKICHKGQKFNWSEECDKAFNHLKEALTSPPILTYPRLDQQFILDTDASNHALGAVLSQEIDGKEHVIAYMSKALNKHETSYCTTRKELLAVVVALKNFHPYLYGREILLRTDNAAVSWMRNLKEPTGQVARWLQILGTYDLKVIHRPGSKHTNADALSRNPCKACLRQETLNTLDQSADKDDKETDKVVSEMADKTTEQTDKKDEQPVCTPDHRDDTCQEQSAAVRAITRSKQTKDQEGLKNNFLFLNGWQPLEIRQQQLADNIIGPIMTAVEADSRPPWEQVSSQPSAVKTLWSQWERLKIHGGMLYRKWEEEGKETRWQLITPEGKKNEILQHYHDVPTAAHLGVEKTLEKIKQSFYWPGMKDFVQTYCRQCDKCFARKPKSQKDRAPLGSYLVGEPMERIAVDILGPLPLTKSKNRFILVITDLFSKWTEAVALPNQESTTVVKAFVDNFICKFGTPLQLHSDQGRNFESELFKDMCNFLGIDKTRTTSFRPQSNGSAERFNRTLAAMLTMYCEKNQNTWDEYLQSVMMAYRSSVHKATSKTPNSMVLGREIVLPLQAVIGQPSNDEDEIKDVDGYLDTLKKKLKENHDIARKSIKQSSNYHKRYYDLKAKKRIFKRGEAVWTYDPKRKVGVCTKLTSPWKGPYIIEKRIDDVTYRIKKAARQTSRIYHVDRMARYFGRNIPTWARQYMKQYGEHCSEQIRRTCKECRAAAHLFGRIRK